MKILVNYDLEASADGLIKFHSFLGSYAVVAQKNVLKLLKCYEGALNVEFTQTFRSEISLIASSENMLVCIEGCHSPMIWNCEVQCEDGINLSFQFKRFPLTFELSDTVVVTSVSCGDYHTLISSKTFVYGFGCNRYGELGLGRKSDEVKTPTLIPLPKGEYPRCIGAGCYFSAIVTEPRGSIYTFGSGSYHRLGHGCDSDDSDVVSPKLLEYFEDIIEASSMFPQVKDSSTGITDVSCGKWHCVALLGSTNALYGWGWNKFFQLGTFHEEKQGIENDNLDLEKDEVFIMSPRLIVDASREDLEIQSVICGTFHTLVSYVDGFGILGSLDANWSDIIIDKTIELVSTPTELLLSSQTPIGTSGSRSPPTAALFRYLTINFLAEDLRPSLSDKSSSNSLQVSMSDSSLLDSRYNESRLMVKKQKRMWSCPSFDINDSVMCFSFRPL